MINKYTYKLIFQTNEPTEWLEKKASGVGHVSNDMGLRTVQLIFDTYALDGQGFEELLKLIDQTFETYSMVVIGENLGHIEVVRKNMPVTVDMQLTFNGQTIDKIWSEGWYE